ncbi:maleylpyruvate isomerase N-terminal domain-containing protein [Actinopolymorpha sp. B11F2]|uniref:maleylpyruvate isomerase N-terminal domain-containing protein n=1 Tax=Actinopolymorpha sp. B11F2 TaxID=3160862 RepID=UPI0032E4A013
MADKGLAAPVPSCPAWTVEDVVSHLADGYPHRVEYNAESAHDVATPADPVFATDGVDEVLTLAGNQGAVAALRRRLALATQ